jgi:hypothetical protein
MYNYSTMKKNIMLCSLLLVGILVSSCKKDRSSSNEDPTAVATEKWNTYMDNDNSNYGQETFEKKSDGSITVRASWHVNETNCSYQNVIMTINDTIISYTASGIAIWQPDPTDKSSFILYIIGSAHNGKSSGNYHINFTTWQEEYQGSFSATRISGSGVTN